MFLPTMKSSLFSLDRQYSLYRHYHQNSTNRRIHAVGVPLIVTSLQALLMAVRLPDPMADLGRVLTMVMSAYYILMSPLLGLLFMPFLGASYLLAQAAVNSLGGAVPAIPLVLLVHVLAWLAQLVGHFGFEGRQPAFFDALLQAFLAAPIVVWLEFAFGLGLAPELKKRLARSRAVSKARKAVSKVVD